MRIKSSTTTLHVAILWTLPAANGRGWEIAGSCGVHLVFNFGE
jgi:hypothetical protein